MKKIASTVEEKMKSRKHEKHIWKWMEDAEQTQKKTRETVKYNY